jgi:GGDEF domain-containing protein
MREDGAGLAAEQEPARSPHLGRRHFALAGAALGWIVPAAAFLLRVFAEKIPWRTELPDHAYFYLFTLAGTTLLLALFGGTIGGKIDALRRRRDWYRDKSRHDDVTGFLVPSAFRQTLGRVIVDARDSRAPIALLLVAVDGATESEADHGSGLTKAILLHVAAAVRHVSPPDAVVSRWGGMEIAVLLPNADVRLDDIPHRLCERIEERPVFDAGARVFCKATIGGVFGVPSLPVDRALRGAQDALSEAHREGVRARIAAV